MQMAVHKISVTGHCLVSVGRVFLKEQDYSRYMHMLLFTEVDKITQIWRTAIVTTGCITPVKIVLQLTIFRKSFRIQKNE